MGERVCKKCGAMFSGRECRKCAIARTKAWKERSPERTREIAKISARRSRRLHPERLSATNKKHYKRMRQWRAENAERVVAYNRTYNQRVQGAPQRRWLENHPLKRREFKARRRAREGAVKVDYNAILALHGMICHICRFAIKDLDLEFDHVIPLAKGGIHNESNIRPSHKACNRRKSFHLPKGETDGIGKTASAARV